jgi:TonB family protein
MAAAYWPPRHAEGLDGTVVVKSFYNRNGRPVRVEVTSSSGSEVLDAHAKKTVLRATCPFVPRSVTQTELSVTTHFNYGKTGPPCPVPAATPSAPPS